MMEVQPIPDAMLAELAQRYQYAGTPWNCRSMPLSESDREYMYMLYYGMQGLVARLRLAEKERDFAKTEIARLHDDIRELTDVRVLDEEDRDRIVAWRQGTSAKPAPSVPEDVMRDAERYRYLRARDDETAGIGCWIEAEGRACDRGWLYGVQLDSAIDTCIEMLAVAPEAKP